MINTYLDPLDSDIDMILNFKFTSKRGKKTPEENSVNYALIQQCLNNIFSWKPKYHSQNLINFT